MIDRDKFFRLVREKPFGGVIKQTQVDGLTAILDQWETRLPDGDLHWLAYMLATAKWETAHTMKPIEEYGHGAGHPYGQPDPETGQTYYGRGYVQLTWKTNYKKLGELLDVDLLDHPELALDPQIAADVMFTGMERGLFTGVGLTKYFNADATDWVNARRIINGTDHAEDIAAIGRQFMAAL